MPFTLPTFNLVCDIYGNTVAGYPPNFPTRVLRQAAVSCALVCGRRTGGGLSATTGGVSGAPLFAMSLLLPALTDIRGIQDTGLVADIVEVPSGSGRWYRVPWVDDVAKGHANEFRVALVVAIPAQWVAPYP